MSRGLARGASLPACRRRPLLALSPLSPSPLPLCAAPLSSTERFQAEELDALRNEHEQHKEQAHDEVTSLQDLLVEREQLVQALSGRDGGRDGGVHRRMGYGGAMDEPLEPMRKHHHQPQQQQQQQQFDDEREPAHDFGAIGSPLRERNHYLHENHGGAVHGSGGSRRDSLLDRIGAFGTKHFGSPGAMGGNVGSLI